MELLSTANPVFNSFAFYAAVVVLKVFYLQILTSVRRISHEVYATGEDVVVFMKDSASKEKCVKTGDDRVERNDLENVLPFLVLGLLYTATAPSAWLACWHFRGFALSRVCHTVAYQLHLQPARFFTYLAGLLVNLSLATQILLFFLTV